VGRRAARRFLAAVTWGLLSLAAAPEAQAAFPGENGKIVFGVGNTCSTETGNADIETINPDGSGVQTVTAGCEPAWSSDGARLAFDWADFPDPAEEGSLHLFTSRADGSGRTNLGLSGTNPSWSPDGQEIAFQCSPFPSPTGICAVNSDGTGYRVLVSAGQPIQPAWSPDGKRVAFSLYNGGIYTVPAEGGGETRVVEDRPATAPNWSPDGRKIAYSLGGDIYYVDVNGGGITRVTETASFPEHSPAWSPDGMQIAFQGSASGFYWDLYVMDADGTDVTRLTTTGDNYAPDWQPLPVNTPSAFARPISANRVQFSLVPAFNGCSATNREHGPPLVFGSCALPVPGSSHLTAGVGDGDPAAARSTGYVRLKVFVGAPGGVDDTNVRVRLNLTNVMRTSDLSEYTGEVRGSIRVRITDVQGSVSSTIQDLPLEFTAPCTPTASTIDKSTCDLGTDLDALVPGASPERTRAIWALDRVKVYDGGPDEDADTTADNALFAVQGLFIP
jgi:WD40 repeat protein